MKTKPIHTVLSIVTIALILSFLQTTNVQADTEPASTPLLPANYQKQIDTFIQENKSTTAGVSLALIQGQDTLYKKKFGYADIGKKAAVDRETVFEWGSVSKLLVWVSVMQQVEQGNIDLDKPIEAYLPAGFLKKLKYDAPITMRHLMHHNAGWEDMLVGLFVDSSQDPATLKETLQKSEPRQVRKPGEAVGYSNYGTALAGYIVERTSGEPFSEYVNCHIFKPLGMKHTAISPKLDDNPWVQQRRQLIQSYSYDVKPIKNSYSIPLYPAGMATGTMDDLVLFAKALLPGKEEQTPIFKKKDTLDEMLSPSLYYGDSQFARNNHGFWTFEYAQPMIGHAGNTTGFSSMLMIHPESKTGFLVMVNQANESIYNSLLPETLFGSYKPAAVSKDSDGTETVPTGFYQSSRIVKHGCAKLYSIIMTMPIVSSTDTALTTSLFGTQLVELKKVAPHVYTSSENSLMQLSDFIYAAATPDGKNTLQMPYMEFVKVDAAEIILGYALLLFFALSILFCVCAMISGLIKWLVTRKNKPEVPEISKPYRIMCLASAAVFVNILLEISSLFAYAGKSALVIHFVVNGIYVICAAVYSVFMILRVPGCSLHRKQKWFYIGSVAAMLLIAVNILYWNLCWF